MQCTNSISSDIPPIIDLGPISFVQEELHKYHCTNQVRSLSTRKIEFTCESFTIDDYWKDWVRTQKQSVFCADLLESPAL